jgi:hypothetical protein
MVKKKLNKKTHRKQGKKARRQTQKTRRRRASKPRSPKIGPNTPYDVCSERMTAFGGLLPLVKFLDLINYKDVFDEVYVSPPRKTKLGCYRMVRGDGEFISWESVCACEKQGFEYIFGNRRCAPPFPENRWYQYKDYEYNECMYQPTGWEKPCRFVVMRIKKEQKGERQLPLFEEDLYVYRVFVTNLSGKPHNVIAEYDKRADVENLVGEAQREGILAIPSKKFQSNHAYFQIVMLAYNLWRWLKLVAGHHQTEQVEAKEGVPPDHLEVVDQTVRLTRLKMLFVAAKISHHSNRDKVYYSIHESRSSGIIDFLDYLDRRRAGKIPWPPIRATEYHATG